MFFPFGSITLESSVIKQGVSFVIIVRKKKCASELYNKRRMTIEFLYLNLFRCQTVFQRYYYEVSGTMLTYHTAFH